MEKLVAATYVIGAVFLLGVLVPVVTVHEQNVQVCTGGRCDPCSSSDSLFSLLFGFPPVSTNCNHSEVTSATSSISTMTAAVNASTMTVNGSPYYADNVTKIMVTEGTTFHFNNGVCDIPWGGVPDDLHGLRQWSPGVPPPPPGAIFVAPSGPGITLNVTFADHSNERIAGAFPLVPVFFHAFSHHINPQAGILIVYTNSSSSFKSYLLVSI